MLFPNALCHEAWPMKSKPRKPDTYICSRCLRDKKCPKKFSAENEMIPSPVPPQLQGLTQVEEMLIACALPIMRGNLVDKGATVVIVSIYPKM